MSFNKNIQASRINGLASEIANAGGVTGSGTLNYIPKWTPSGIVIGNSIIYDNGTSVGIGTISPASKLDILTSSGLNAINITSDSITDTIITLSTNNAVTSRAKIYISDSAQTLNFYTVNNDTVFWNGNGLAQVETMRLTSGGKIGIGTYNPTQKLHISSTGTGGVLTELNDAMFDVNLSGSAGQLRFSYGSNIEFMINPYPSASNTSFRFKSNPSGTSNENGIEHTVLANIAANAGSLIGEALNIGSTGTNTGTIIGKIIRKSGFNNTNATFYPLIILDGNTGIGTNTPTSSLDINGTTGYSQFRIRTSYTPTGTADSNGNTGDITWDDDYIYVKTSIGWKRSTLSTF